MSRFVPFLAEDVIERDAVALLDEFELARGVVVEPPVPIEDIVEKHLKLGIEFDDMHERFNLPRSEGEWQSGPDILGAIYFDKRRIVIDQSLDPDERPSLEGRYRFTLAHEGGGHWRLHRRLFAGASNQDWLFDEPPPPSVICRSSQGKEPVEWQADYYASCVLMPRKLLLAAWRARFGNGNARILRPQHRMEIPADADEALAAPILRMQRQLDDEAMENYVRPFAQQFKVSPVAMRIRLEKLGLLHRETPRQRSLAIGR